MTMIDSVDPRTGDVIGQVPVQSADHVRAAVARAREAFAVWSQVEVGRRIEHMLAVRDLMLDRADEIVEVVCAETGKLRAEAVSSELLETCELIEF
jgi:acyl-CoA reductase-like NAD-dependent aldehyde dehydrogenase